MEAMHSATGGADDQQIKNLQMGMDIVVNTVPQVIRVLNSDRDDIRRQEIINELRTTVSAYIEKEREYQDSMDALATSRIQIRDQIDAQETALESNPAGNSICTGRAISVNVDEIFQAEKSKLPKVSLNYINKHPKMKEFESRVSIELQALMEGEDNIKDSDGIKVTQDDGGEIIATEMVSTMDPITRQEMTDPVRNTLCGHTYERNSILQLVSKNSKTKCPMAGCANKSPVTQNHLILNSDVLRIIQQKNRNPKRY